MQQACCSSGSASAWYVSVPVVRTRRRRYVGFQQFVVLKYLAESGPPWEMSSSWLSVWEEMLEPNTSIAFWQPQLTVPALLALWNGCNNWFDKHQLGFLCKWSTG